MTVIDDGFEALLEPFYNGKRLTDPISTKDDKYQLLPAFLKVKGVFPYACHSLLLSDSLPRTPGELCANKTYPGLVKQYVFLFVIFVVRKFFWGARRLAVGASWGRKRRGLEGGKSRTPWYSC